MSMLLGIITGIGVLVAVLVALGAKTAWLLGAIAGFIVGWVGALILALLFLVVACQIVDKEKPQEKDSKFYRSLAKHYIAAILQVGRVRVCTQGMEQLPKDGRFMMVCNHIHDVDSGVLLHCFADQGLAFIAKQEVKEFFLVGSILHKLQCQPINRENDREALKTILNCIRMLKEDLASIMVFPEGYVSLDGKLRHFRSGVFKIAQKANVPVVVCTLKGTKEVLPRVLQLKPAQVQMHLVGVVSAEQVKAVTTVELAEQVYDMMIADMGEEYRCDEKSMHPDMQKQMMEQNET